MRAVWLREFGPPSVLVAGEAPDPVAGPGQVLIDVAFANITFVETQFRATGEGPFATSLPMIPGNGVGGHVVAGDAHGRRHAGPPGDATPGGDPGRRHAAPPGDATPAGDPGRRVVASTGGSGAYAERVAVDASALYDVPDGRTLEDATALLADGRTATLLARAAAIRAGERVLVLAAAGGVGTLLVQLAAAAGALVVGAAGSTSKLPLVRSLGASASLYADAEGPFDVVFDGVGGDVARAAFAQTARGARMLSYGLASGSWAAIDPAQAAERGVRLVQPDRSPAALRSATESALSGPLQPVIGQRFPLERAADAHAAIETRATVGKTLLDVG